MMKHTNQFNEWPPYTRIAVGFAIVGVLTLGKGVRIYFSVVSAVGFAGTLVRHKTAGVPHGF